MCGFVQLCYRPLWSLIVAGVFMVVFVSLTAWMWVYRSRQSRHVIIRACLCLSQLSQLIAFARNEIVAGIFQGATSALLLIAMFGFAWNAATLAFMTTRLANEAPPWLPRYTMVMQIFVSFAFPLLTLIGGLNTVVTCAEAAVISKLLGVVMMYGIALPVFVSHFKIRKMVNKHRESMPSTGATERDVERDNELKKPMRTLLYQSVFMVFLVVLITIMNAVLLVGGERGDMFYTECDTGSEVGRVFGYQLWQLLLLWHSNVKDGRRKVKGVTTKQLTSSVTPMHIKKKADESCSSECVTNAASPSACRSQENSPQDDDGAPDTTHDV